VSAKYCKSCGAPLGLDVQFCRHCGAKVEDGTFTRAVNGQGGGIGFAQPGGKDNPQVAFPGLTPDLDEEKPVRSDGKGLEWIAKYPMVSRHMIKPLILITGASFLFVSIFIGILQPAAFGTILVMMFIVFLIIVGIGAIITIAMQKATQGGFDTKFSITPDQVGYEALKEWKDSNRLALAGTVLCGSVVGVGGGLSAISREEDTIEWSDVGSITIYRLDRALLFTRKILVFPMTIFCCQENFEEVIHIVREYALLFNIQVKEG
jgi:hypothetical protein